MNQKLSKYHMRSPRFILDTEDETLIRVAGPQRTPWEEGTKIRDISLSGLAFTAPADLCPQPGEFIKIQFTPPNSMQMACHGLVTRLGYHSKDSKLVAVHFYKLEMGHRIALAKGLQEKVNKIKEQSFLTENGSQLFQMADILKMSLFLSIGSLMIVSLLSYPIGTFYSHWIELIK